MLRDWSDRAEPRRERGASPSTEYLPGALAALPGLAIIAGVVAWFRG